MQRWNVFPTVAGQKPVWWKNPPPRKKYLFYTENFQTIKYWMHAGINNTLEYLYIFKTKHFLSNLIPILFFNLKID